LKQLFIHVTDDGMYLPGIHGKVKELKDSQNVRKWEESVKLVDGVGVAV